MKHPIALLALLPSLLFAASNVWNGTVNTAWYDASKTEFIITTAEQLAGLAQLVNSGTSMEGKTIKLGDDIVLNNTTGWENWATSNAGLEQWNTIGNYYQSFQGIFDGDGHVISGVYINSGSDCQGLFGSNSGTIKNLGVVASYIKGGYYVGGLVGWNVDGSATISNSYATGNVSGASGVGGLAGGNIQSAKIINSYATGNVSGENDVGGLVGWNVDGGATINNSFATGNVSGTGSSVGGLAGFNGSGIITNSYYDKETSGQSDAGKGIPKTTQYMQSEEFVETLQFVARIMSSIWIYSEGEYPKLSYADYLSGDGTEENPYIIETKEQLDTFSLVVNFGRDYSGKHLKLGNDITINNTTDWQSWNEETTGLTQWTAIGGTSSPSFQGTFDGDGHVISGVYINSGSDYQGLFSSNSGTIKNLGVVASYIKGGSYVGGLVGYNSGTITNSYATGNVAGTRLVGGLVGNNSGTITNSYATGNVAGTGDYDVVGTGDYVGGLVGINGGTITNSYATGNVSGTSHVGGLAGDGGTITNSYATGNVAGTGDYVGGLVGSSYYGTITNSYYDRETSDQNDDIGKGIPKTTEYMQSEEFVETLQFVARIMSSTWIYSEGEYPKLSHAIAMDYLRGAGTKENPYIIDTKEQLDTFSLAVNFGRDYSGKHLKLGNDITINNTTDWQGWNEETTGLTQWTAIGGTSSPSFQGTFDGDGHVISGVYINSGSDYQGLFRSNSGTIKNLGVVASYIKGSSYVGGLVGNNSGTITNSYATGNVSGTGDVGGLVGKDYYGYGIIVTITNSYYDKNKSGATGDYGIGLTTDEMKNISTYIAGNWDFDLTWAIVPYINDGYPILQYQLKEFEAKQLPENITVNIVGPAGYVYNDNRITPEVTIIYNPESITLVKNRDYTVSYGDNVNASTGTITITGKFGYTGTVIKDFPIAAKDLTSSMATSIPSQKYTGQAIEPEVTLKDGNKTLTLETDYTVRHVSNINPTEEATIIITGIGNYSGAIAVFYEIEKIKVSVAWQEPFDFEYNGQNRCPSATATLPNYAPITPNISCTAVNASTEPYTATATYPSTTYELFNNTILFTISRAPITTTLEIPNIIEGATLIPTVKGIKENPTINYRYSTGRNSGYTQTAPATAGVYYAYATVSATNNYRGSTTDTISFSIYKTDPTPISVSWSEPYNFIYNGTEQSPDASLDGTPFPLIIKGATDVGTHTATARFQTERMDYKLTNAEKQFTITAKPLPEDAIEPIVNYFYTGLQIRPENITVKDGSKKLAEGIDYTISYGTNISESGTITVIGKGNYSGTASRSFPISSYGATVVSVNWSTAETFTYNGSKQAPTATASSHVIEIIGEQTDAGSHTAVAQLKTPNPNIILTNASMPYTIAKKQLDVTWTPERKFVYNKMIQVPKPSVDESGVALRISNAYSEVGEYTAANMLAPYALIISPNASNYELLNNSVDYSITKKPISIGINDGDKISLDMRYIDNIESIRTYLFNLLTYNGFAKNTETGEEDNSSILSGSPSISVSEIKDELDTLDGFIWKKYSVSIDASAVNAKNYTASGKTYTIPVSSAALVPVIWGSTRTFTYDGTEHAPTATAGDYDIEVIGKQSNAGGYTATAQLKTSNDRVFLQNENMPYTIAKKQIEVTWETKKEYIYNKMTQGPIPNVDEPGVVLRAVNIYSGVGKYTDENKLAPYAEIISANAGNYELLNNTVDYEILPKPLKPYFSTTLPAFEYNTDTLRVPSEVFTDSTALLKILEQIIAYYGFATDSEGNSDDATVLSGTPKVSIAYAAALQRSMLYKRVETSQRATATIITDGMSADNYTLTRPAVIMIMETMDNEAEADKINCYRGNYCTELSKEVCEFIEGKEVPSCAALKKACVIDKRCVPSMLIGECTGIGGKVIETTCEENSALRLQLAGGKLRVWQTASGMLNVDLGYMPAAPVALKVYDLKGKLIASEQVNTRFANIRVDVPSGVYLFIAGNAVSYYIYNYGN